MTTADQHEAPISRAFFETLSTAGIGRAQAYVDYLDVDGSIIVTVAVASPAPLATVRDYVDRVNARSSS
jgi:hypothetical protein